MKSVALREKPPLGKNFSHRRWHQGNQSVSRGRRWGKSTRCYDGTSGVPEFVDGAYTGAFSRLFNDEFSDAVRQAESRASNATDYCRQSEYCNLSTEANASYVYRDRDGEFSASAPGRANSSSLPNPGGAFNSINTENGNVSISILNYEYVQQDAVGLAVYQAYSRPDFNAGRYQDWANLIDGPVHVTSETTTVPNQRTFDLRRDTYCPGGACQ